jgi:hypothetical protein
MRPFAKPCCVFAACSVAAAAWASQWFSLAGRDSRPDDTHLEVDLSSVHLRGDSGEAVIRVTYDVLQPHAAGFGYRSFIATAQVDCRHQSVLLASAAYFALPGGEGPRVGADSAGRDAGMPSGVLDAIPRHQRMSLIRAACSGPAQ